MEREYGGSRMGIWKRSSVQVVMYLTTFLCVLHDEAILRQG